jgi:outer membrane receptor protein involved in Fe transport
LLGLAVAVALAAAAKAQQVGSIRGTVTDKDFESALAGATIQLVETGAKVESNDQGAFVFGEVRPGNYTLIAAKDGYVRTVRGDVIVAAGQLTEVRLELAGDFTDMEEFVVEDALQTTTNTEAALLDLRTESPALLDSISSDLMKRANAGDAVGALKLVSGASSADGKSAVVRGLPDRYVSSQINSVILPSADKSKRAVELDLIPSEVIQSLQVSKTFTPDQQGNASGGAVNVLLKGVPDEPAFLNWKLGSAYNSQYTGRSDFLTYRGGGVSSFGKSGSEYAVQENGENWEGAVGTTTSQAPVEYKGSLSGGFRVDIAKGWRAGAFVNVFYDRDNSFVRNGVDDSYWALRAGDPLTPQFNQGNPSTGEFYTSLFDVQQSRQSAQWGGLAIVGISSDQHALTYSFLSTRTAEDNATRLQDTRGKQYYFPGHDPDVPTSPGFDDFLAAPYLRLQTLSYVERAADTQQLSGRHRFPLRGTGPVLAAELDYTLAQSVAERSSPDRRQFATAWNPAGVYLQYKPAAQFLLGNHQRIFELIEETSDEQQANLKLPFTAWAKNKGYLKAGWFRDRVERTFNQDTFSNFNDPNFFQPGQFDELDWTDVWAFSDHPISDGSDFDLEFDVDYAGRQDLDATYLMAELPITRELRLIGGVRWERTRIGVVNTPEDQALWIPPRDENGNPNFGTAPLLPGVADVDYAQDDELPAISAVYEPHPSVTLRASYAETVARQTFREITPVFQQEFLGGPIFVGNPELRMSAIRNYDLRADWRPYEGGLFSASWFRKKITNPIEYIEKIGSGNFSYTTAANFPSGDLTGIELETRQSLGAFWDPLKGIGIGANGTWLEAKVDLLESDLQDFEDLNGVRPRSQRDMTNAPDYLYNLFGTYDIEATGTTLGLFYTVTGETLVQGPGPSSNFYIPPTYETRYESFSATLSQPLGRGLRLSLSARNLTDALRRQVYRSEFNEDDVTRRTYTEGVEWSLSIGGEFRF